MHMRPTLIEVYNRLLILKHVVVYALSNPPENILLEVSAQWTKQDKDDYDKSSKERSHKQRALLKQVGMWQHITSQERNFLESFGFGIKQKQIVDASWKAESAVVLMWALGWVENFPKMDEEVDPDILKSFDGTKKVDALQLRPFEEIEKKRELMESWHWRVRTKQLIDSNFKFSPPEAMKKDGIQTLDDVVKLAAKIRYEQGDLPKIIDEDYVFLGKPFRTLQTGEVALAQSIICERHFALNWLCGMAPKNEWDKTPTNT